ncbi:MAG: hypothetical protein IPP17_28965 [Bacteroidetes bacterium]|nr:hypothetical protein [Bacteroidota bacterium]
MTLENQRLLNEKLEAENVSNARELATTTLHIIQKNEVLERLNAEISPLLKESELSSQIKLQLQSLREASETMTLGKQHGKTSSNTLTASILSSSRICRPNFRALRQTTCAIAPTCSRI